jgi:hypothetical protein
MKFLVPVALVALSLAVTAGSAFAGGDAGPPLYPSAVNVQLVRTEALLQKATDYQDEGDAAKAVAALTATRSHLKKAWTAAKYIIDHAPPPVAADGGVAIRVKVPAKPKVVPKAKAHTSGGAVAGASPFADQYQTAVGVLNLQHDVATTALGMLDTASGPLLSSVSTSLFYALNARDTAIAYIKKIQPPPVAADGGVPAHSSGGAVAGSWATVMPGVAPYIDDEVQQIEALRASTNLSPGRTTVLSKAEIQDIDTGKTITQTWPPVVGG